MNSFSEIFSPTPTLFFLGSVIGILILYGIISYLFRRLGKNPKFLLPEGAFKRLSWPIFTILTSILLRSASLRTMLDMEDSAYYFRKASTLLFIFAFTWLLLNIIKIVKGVIIQNYNVETANNLKARKIYTQFNILERIFIFVTIILAVGAALMSFQEIRDVGVGIFASAGVAGIIIGFSAQKMIGTILAGIQIAIAQPIKMDDVVIVEGEWGRIEEITLTYVAVKIWDKRRLILPTPYFIEKPFQNWTKSSSDIIGTVFLHMDYRVPFDELRTELTKILEKSDLWDGEANNIQVTDSKAGFVEVRAMVSARDASDAWDLRVLVREKLISFLQENYPESIARTRHIVETNENFKDNS